MTDEARSAEGLILTALYVPGDRPDLFDKAVASGADAVLLDLEDGVAPAAKARARESVVAWLSARSDATVRARPAVQVRVNADSALALDCAALRSVGTGVHVRLPKVESAIDVANVVARLGATSRVTALLESALGVQRAAEVAAHPAVVALALGEVDLASDLRSAEPAVLDHARLTVLFAARAAGLPVPMLSVYPNIDDLDGLRRDTERGRELGLRGRVAVHPKQLPIIRTVFAPSDDSVRWATQVVAAMTDGGGVTTLADGSMVDPAMLDRARDIMALQAVLVDRR